MGRRSKSSKKPVIQNYPNGYASKGITIESEKNGVMYCIQHFSGAVSEDELHCGFVKMKKQGDGRIIRNGNIIMRCIFRDDELIHGMIVDEMKEPLIYDKVKMVEDVSMLKACLEKQKDSQSYEIYTRTLVTRLLYDPSIKKRNMTKYIDFMKHGYGYILFSAPFDQLVFFVEWKNGVYTGVGYLVDFVSFHILEKVTFDNEGIEKVEIVFPSQYSSNQIMIDSNQWEGDIWNNQANGYGILRDSQNHVLYYGMMLHNLREGYGIAYTQVNDTMKKVYEGMWSNNQRHGEGISYTTNGKVEYTGVFCEDQPVELLSIYKNQPSYHLTTGVESLYIGDNCLNSISNFSFYSLANLTILRIGNNSFQYIHNFTLSSFSKLESIIIGNNCFYSPIADNNTEGFLTISDNPSLKSIHCGYHSFLNYSSCSLQNLPSLQSLILGIDIDMSEVLKAEHIQDPDCCSYLQVEVSTTNSFLFTQELHLDELPSLEYIRFGSYAFKNVRQLSIHLPSLQSLLLETGSLPSINTSSIELPKITSLLLSSCFIPLESLSSTLQSLHLGNHSLNSLQTLDFSQFQLLHDLEIGEDSLNYLVSFQLSNLSHFESLVIEDNSLTAVQSFTIENCQQCCSQCLTCSLMKLPSLQSLFFMSDCFVHTTSLKIQDLPNVDSIEFQRNCFTDCSVIEIVNFPKVENIIFGNATFINVDTVIIMNLPACLRITFFVDACKGIPSSTELVLKMKNLPKLQSLIVNDGSLENCGNVIIEELPAVTTVQLKKDCFKQATCILKKDNVASILVDSLKGCGDGCSVVLV